MTMSAQESKKVERKAMGKQITEQRGGLSWIRPQMMQQVFSSIALSQEKRALHFPTQMELLNLFPLEQDTIASSCPPCANEVRDSRSTAELTIFYNGAVKAYHVSADKAQAIMKLAERNGLSERATSKPLEGENQQSREVKAGVPMARKLSLQRFLQKRKGRVGSTSPYASTAKKTGSKASAEEDEDEYEQLSLSLSLPSQRCG